MSGYTSLLKNQKPIDFIYKILYNHIYRNISLTLQNEHPLNNYND